MSNVKLLLRLANKGLQKNLGVCSKIEAKQYSDWIPQEKETHTGQKWADNDYRLARFVGRPKNVNENVAMNLIDEVPPVASKDRVVCCDGGHPATGHPRVYINLDKPGNHTCGYCGLRYYLDHCH